jgi:hypothetical protein
MHCPVAWQCGAPAADQQSETIVESLGYLLYPECASSRRR